MNRRVVYIASGVVIITILGIVLVINNFGPSVGNFSSVKLPDLKLPSVNVGEQIFNEEAMRDARSLVVSIKDVHVEPVNKTRAKVNVIFDIFNPNKATVMLEVISYNLYTNSGRMVSGDIGEKPTGFVGSQANIFPIVGNGSIMLKDSKVIEREGPSETSLDDTVGNTQHYIINGTFSYKQTSSFQSSGGENNYSLTFPWGVSIQPLGLLSIKVQSTCPFFCSHTRVSKRNRNILVQQRLCMADLLITYAITALMFVILGGVVFGARSRRYNQQKNLGLSPNSWIIVGTEVIKKFDSEQWISTTIILLLFWVILLPPLMIPAILLLLFLAQTKEAFQ